MEKLEGVPLEGLAKSTKPQVEAVLDNLSSQGFVHGDLCPQNILRLADGSIRVVDFDWAGLAGVVKYPEDLNVDCNWHPEVEAGAPITEIHDYFQYASS